jgi:hypothetical protein
MKRIDQLIGELARYDRSQQDGLVVVSEEDLVLASERLIEIGTAIRDRDQPAARTAKSSKTNAK